MRSIFRRGLLLVFIIIGLFLLSGPVGRAYEALLLVGEIGGYAPPPLLQTRSEVSVRTLSISGQSRHYDADLYLPEDSPEAGIVLLHGAAQTGKDDPRLIAFARQLAARRFAVLIPELPGPKQLRIRAEDAQDAVDAFHFLNGTPGLEKRVGIGGISVSAGLAFLAALNPELRDEVAFIVSVGGYHNLPRTLEYAITGQFLLDGTWHHQTPNTYGKWLFVLSNLDALRYRTDQQALRSIAFRRMVSPGADISDLTSYLSAEGRAVLVYVTEDKRQRIAADYAALPTAMRQHIEALDLANKELQRLTARVLLVHGYDDTVIPYAESISLSRALPPDKVELFLLHGLDHVESHPQRLQDAWTFWQASYALLQLRDRRAN